jgi:hypothetical protein
MQEITTKTRWTPIADDLLCISSVLFTRGEISGLYNSKAKTFDDSKEARTLILTGKSKSVVLLDNVFNYKDILAVYV